MMAQGELAFKYEEDRQGEGMTGMAGIGTYLDLVCRSGLVRSIERHVKARSGLDGRGDGCAVDDAELGGRRMRRGCEQT